MRADDFPFDKVLKYAKSQPRFDACSTSVLRLSFSAIRLSFEDYLMFCVGLLILYDAPSKSEIELRQIITETTKILKCYTELGELNNDYYAYWDRDPQIAAISSRSRWFFEVVFKDVIDPKVENDRKMLIEALQLNTEM